jgi:DNA (cytosine-5)-methyltransferase 1
MNMQPNSIIVDNFAGGGGASTGMEMALGFGPDYAINHDDIALGMHAANHPGCTHMINDVWEVDPFQVSAGRPVSLAWFSPDCRHHSKAKGGKPVSDSVRDLAWVAVKWAKMVRPRVIMLENVEEFQLWGPLTDEGKPCRAQAGDTFSQFVQALKNLGYDVEWKELRASDYGVPTIRKRLFLIARCDGRPIVWPAPTHADPKLNTGLAPWKTAAEIIDWSVPVPSIFDTSQEIKEKFGLQTKRPLAENTLKRIAKGVQKFVVEDEDPFFISYGQHGGRSRSAFEPMHTITASRKDQNQLVVPTFTKVAAFLAQHNTGVIGRPANVPLSTLTTRGTQQNLVAAHLMSMHGSSRRARDARTPLATITAGGGHAALVSAFMVKYYGTAVGQTIDEPLHSLTTKGRFGLVTCQIQGEEYAIVDIGMRMLTPREQFRAQGFPDSYEIETTADGRPIPKTHQTHKCGNSVCPPVVAALINANLTMKEQVCLTAA